MEKTKTKKFMALNICIAVILSAFIESYIILIENANLVVDFSTHDFINLFSFKEFFVFLIIFIIIFYLLSDSGKKVKLFNFIYNYRLPICLSLFIIAIIFQIHGSSINEMNLFGVQHKPLLGVSRPIRSDEYVVNTMYAFSQYMNDFGYFSDIVRATATDMFIIYGQPVLDMGIIFRPFLIGYLFLNPGQGLSFFWIGRLIFLLLISFEFGMLLTNKNKVLSLSYALLIAFSPVVQWWFAINGLVEQLIFGQLGVLLINLYMNIEDYRKRILIAFGLMICVGTFLLVFYPSWQIPYAYVFILLASWIFLKNKSNFSYNRKDAFIFIIVFSIFTMIIVHILSNSLETIKIILNTSYPGSQIFNGKGSLSAFLYYIPTIFYPLNQETILTNVCNYSVFVDLFPVPLIISGIVIFYQKTKDKLLMGLLALYILFAIFYLIHFPDIICNLTLRSHIKTSRLPSVITFIGILILIRSITSLKELKRKKIFITVSIILSVLIVFLSTLEYGNYYSLWMLILAVIIYSLLFSVSFLASSKRNQKIFLICIIALSFLTGALVNPVEQGTDVIFESDFFHQVEKIVEKDSNGIWITEGRISDTTIPAGAKTINSVNTYPDVEKWQKLDKENEYYDIYNRYAHISVNLHKNKDTSFKLNNNDSFTLNLNINDLEKLNITYIVTYKDLDNFSNEHIEFIKLWQDKKYNIYNVKYK